MDTERLVIGMSGGVDSSAAALILHQQQFDLVGITLKLWHYESPSSAGRCCTPQDVRDARQVAFQLGIPFYVLDHSLTFSDKVVDYFTNEYLTGRTPNPCIMCNNLVKFRYLIEHADEIGAQRIATGHYARVEFDPADQRYRLLRGLDHSRDQSYFLFSLPQETLRRLILPLGALEKNEVRELLRQAQLHTADKGESREICFVENNRYAEFVERRVRAQPSRFARQLRTGKVVDEDGQELGQHDGIHRYTVGQRRGLGISARQPLYVQSIDAEQSTVTVAPKALIEQSDCELKDVQWLTNERPSRCEVQLRYKQKPFEIDLDPLDDRSDQQRMRIAFLHGRKEVPSPGQAAVFYDGDRVLGGGWIL